MVNSTSRHPQGQNDRSERAVEPNSHDYLLAFIGRNKRVLEFGCSSARLAQQLSAAGCRVTAVASDAEVGAEAREWCERVVVCDLDTLPFSDLLAGETFDVVVFNDVFQQLRDPLEVLEETRGCLGAGGVVAISMPNLAPGARRLAGLREETHSRSFTLKTLYELCLRAGFRIERIERTKVAFLSRSELSPSVLPGEFERVPSAEVESDPDRDTLQFVITATPLNEADKYQYVLGELLRTRQELERERQRQTAPSSEAEDDRLCASEALERENADLRSAICELQRSIEDARSSVATRDKDHERAIGWLREQNRTLRGVQADLRERLSERVAAAESVASLETALAEREQLLDAAWANAETLVRHNEREIALTKRQIADADARLARIHGSVFWKMKLRILALRGRLRSLVHAAGG